MSTKAPPKRMDGTLSGLRQAGIRRKRRHLVKMCAGVATVAASIVAVAVLALQFGKISSPDAESAAARFASTGTAPILIHPETKDCRNKTFDNRTGAIWDSADPCPGTPVDARGVPVPLGTVNTLNSISRSFK